MSSYYGSEPYLNSPGESYTLERIEGLRKIHLASTNVNCWYPHGHNGTVRGPFTRWFRCTRVGRANAKSVSSVHDDTVFAAAAMNHFGPLLITVERQRREIAELKKKLRAKK